MENKARVLAYTLAKEIEPEQLTEVSGGAAQNMTSGTTYRVTGSTGNVEAFVDWHLDW